MSAQDTLGGRYGAAAPWQRRAAITASVALGVVFLAWLAWAVYEHSTPRVTSQLESYSIEDDHTVTAVLVVSINSPNVKASCTLRAFAEDHTTVGELTFTPDTGKGRRQVETIRTERRATSVQNVGCTAPGQDHPR